MFNLTSIATDAIGTVFLYANGILAGFLGNLLAMVAGWLGAFLKLQGGYFETVPIVQESWKVFRDFSNMFFILILIVIAFATILDLKNYNWQKLMVKFIIAALLINFSMTIGGFLIRASTNLSNVALSQFGDITSNLAGGFGLNKLISGTATLQQTSIDGVGNAIVAHTISGFGMIIMTAIVLLAFISAFAFAVARVPVLWALLIVSPVAWISYVLPQTRRVWNDWWKWFFCWTFFMPAYLFSLVIGVAILANRSDIDVAISQTGGSGLAAGVGNILGFGVQDIFFYILTILILVGSLGLSMKLACAGGTGVGKVMGGITGAVNGWAKRTSYLSAFQKAGNEKLKEIQKTGLPGGWSRLYGGERAQKLKEAKVAEGIFGKSGSIQAEKDRIMREDIKTYKERFKATTDVEELKKNMKEGPREQKLAIAELLKEKGELSVKDMKDVYDLYQEAGSDSNAIEFAKSIDYDKLSRTERADLYESLGSQSPEVARKIVMSMAEKGDWKSESPEEVNAKLKKYSKLFTQEGDKNDFLNKVQKFNFEETIQFGVESGLRKVSKTDPATGRKIPHEELTPEERYDIAMENAIKGMNMDKVSELSADALDKLVKNSKTKDLLKRKLTADNISSFEGKLTENQLEALKDILETKKKEFENQKEEAAKKAAELQAESLAKAMQKAQPQQGTVPGGTTPPTSPAPPRRTPGFVPPGSTVSGGEVKNQENVNPNNVLDLRSKT